ncbi:hypothetical protein K2X33_16685 [bacterium]|nr:hypothetical protein [bacterium]
MRSLFTIGILGLFLTTTAMAADNDEYEQRLIKKTQNGLFLTPMLGMGWTLFTNGNEIDGGAGVHTGVNAEIFLSRNVGLYAGFLASRTYSPNNGPELNFGTVPAGIAFQFHPYNADIVATIGVGVAYGAPLSSFRSAGSVLDMKPIWGFHARTAVFFPLADGVELGLTSEGLFSFNLLVRSSLDGPNMIAANAGLAARIHL